MPGLHGPADRRHAPRGNRTPHGLAQERGFAHPPWATCTLVLDCGNNALTDCADGPTGKKKPTLTTCDPGSERLVTEREAPQPVAKGQEVVFTYDVLFRVWLRAFGSASLFGLWIAWGIACGLQHGLVGSRCAVCAASCADVCKARRML